MRTDLNNILAKKGAEALLLYSDSYKDANMYYLTGFLAPDPFIFLKRVDSDPIIVVNQMEYSRAKKQSYIKNVRSYLDYDYLQVMKSSNKPKNGFFEFIVDVTKKELGKETKICVPPDFPVILADFLRNAGLTIEPILDVIEVARETKSIEEVEIIKDIQRVNESVTSDVIELIENSDIGSNKTIFYKGESLTVGKIKTFFGSKLLEHGCFPEDDIIVSCGTKSSDPHFVGESEDKLKADQPIILDIYPRSIHKRYWTDMTRTIVRGRASKIVRDMFETVFEAKNASLDAIKAGARGNEIYDICCDLIEKAGYQTTRSGKTVARGMTHSLGHGVGLQIHESPRISEFSVSPLQDNTVVTVEPGIYYPKVGGVRLEDIIEVTKSGYNNLTSMETILEI